MRGLGRGIACFTVVAWAFTASTDVLGGSIDFVSTAHAEDTGEVVTVEVDGIGATADDALKNALRMAVQEAVGTLVDEQTQVANDKLINDTVLSYSNGFIEHIDTLSAPAPDRALGGLYKCRIRAIVKRGDVAKKLEAIPMVSSEVAGEQMWAQALSKVQGVEDGRKLLTEFHKRRPLHRLLVARVVDKNGKPAGALGLEKTPNYDKGTTTLRFGVQIFEDTQTYYTRYAAPLTALLDKIGTVKQPSVTLDAGATEHWDRAPAGTECIQTQGMASTTAAIHRDAIAPGGGRSTTRNVVIATGRNANGSNLRFRTYSLEAAAYDERFLPDRPFVWDGYSGESRSTFPTLAELVELRVTLIDGNGRTVQSLDVRPRAPAFGSYERAYYLPGVGFLGELDFGNGTLCSSVITPVSMEIPNDDLRNVTSIAVEIVPASGTSR
jgi:hypothetical protein